MRIEIMVGSDDPQIYPLEKPKIIIGSSDVSDITLDEPGVSRKHLIIGTEEDSYFVIDQGSTNGTFINEERLIPGRRTDFTVAAPVRLGDNVLISLLSEEDALESGYELPESKPAPEEKTAASTPAPILSEEPQKVPVTGEITKMISLKDLQNAKTETLVKRRAQVVAKKKANASTKRKQRSNDELKRNLFRLTVIFVLGGAIIYNKFFRAEESPDTPAEEVQLSPASEESEGPSTTLVPATQNSARHLREKLEALHSDIKYTTELEKYLYGKNPGLDGKLWKA